MIVARACRVLLALIAGALAVALLVACAGTHNSSRTFEVPSGIDEDGLRAHAVVKAQDRIRVAAAVPNDAETQAMFGVDLAAKGIQPLWLEITNRGDRAFVFLPTGLDPEYFSPREAAFLFKGGLGDRGYRALADYLESVSLTSREPIRPGATVSGIVYTNREVPTIAAAVELVGENWSKRINLLVPVPGTESVQRRLEELETIVRNQPTKTIADEAALRRALEALPCCAAAEDGTTDGPPLNLVVIGDPGDVISSFAHSLYRYRPVSPMRAFGREQDLSGKRISRWVAPKSLVIRGWIAPLRFRGEPVLVLQASTSRGGRFAPADALADDIDPRVDDARDAVIQEMLYSQSVSKLGFVRGASGTHGSFPTDGLRAVVLIDAMPVSLSHIDFFDWERPGDVSEHRSESGE